MIERGNHRPLGTVLVTGGTGVVGSAIVHLLARMECRVRVLSRRRRPPDSHNVSYIQGDVTREADLAAALRDCDGVFHCAAEKIDESRMRAVNTVGTARLLRAANSCGVRFLCQLSSVGVVGRTRQATVDETCGCAPATPYEISKCEAERVLSPGLDNGIVIILRPTNVFGPETLRPYLRGSFVQKLRLMLKGRELSHLLYVKDLAAAAVYCMSMSGHRALRTFIVSCDEDGHCTNRDVQGVISSYIATANGPPAVALPPMVPHLLRMMRRGTSTLGSVVYSGARLRREGFRYPYGLRRGLVEALEMLESSDPGGTRGGDLFVGP